MKLKNILPITAIVITVFFAFAYAQKPTKQNSKIEKIPFVYDKNDFGKVEITHERKVNAEDEAVKSEFPIDLPAHTCFNLEVKRSLPAFEKGARYFFPAYSFVCLIPTSDTTEKDFATGYPNFSKSVIKLRHLLEKRPLEFRQFDDLFDIPYNNASWSFKSKIQYVNYKNISGVMFLTQYSQELTPNLVNNEELTANFQGLTKDGKFYVAARFATTHPTLPKGIDFTDSKIQEEALVAASNDKTNQKVRKYMEAEKEKVEKLLESEFQPSLINLKKLIASIEIR